MHTHRVPSIIISVVIVVLITIVFFMLLRQRWFGGFWSFHLHSVATQPKGENQVTSAPPITIWLSDSDRTRTHIASISRDKLYSFWKMLDVSEVDWRRLQENRRNGSNAPIVPTLPLLSELVDMDTENLTYNQSEIPELQREIDSLSSTNSSASHNEVLSAIRDATVIATTEHSGLILSPFG